MAQRTKAVPKTLAETFKAAHFPHRRTDSAACGRRRPGDGRGPVHHKLFHERPDLEQEFTDIAAFNAIVALDATRRFAQARKDARDKDERSLAKAAHLSHCLEIRSRSNTMVPVEGHPVSSAIASMA